MKNIIFNYIFKKLLVSLFIVSPIVIMMVWLAVSIKHIGLIVSEDISVISFLKLIFCSISDIAGITLSICSLIASISVFYKMQIDKEILVFMASGKSKISISSPLFTFSCFIAVLILIFQTMLIPSSYKKLINIQDQIRNQISMSIVKPGVFNVVGDSIIYIREKNENSLNDVFISYIPRNKKSHTNIITAKSGSYSMKDNNLIIELRAGYRQELDENNNAISTLKFENFSYDVTEFIKNFSKKIRKLHEKTQKELRIESETAKDISIKNKCLAEYHRRLTLPFIAIINAIVLSAFMISPNFKIRHGIRALKTFLCGIVCQICVMTMINASTKYIFLIPINYFAILVICMFFISFRRKYYEI
ncbi:MAG: LptF/LptG family permease [Holosporales bacterium]|jgi:lipopolysaccharide export system permease protein|nr:LptF/LptG family permease [Holosporales bacterium]